MICRECRNRNHGACPGGSWCDCQHRPASKPAPEPLTLEPAVMAFVRDTVKAGGIDQDDAAGPRPHPPPP